MNKKTLIVIPILLISSIGNSFLLYAGPSPSQLQRFKHTTPRHESPYESYEKLHDKTKKNGWVRVIVGLKCSALASSSEPMDEATLNKVKNEVKALTDAVLSELHGGDFEAAGGFDFSPYFSVTVSQAGFEKLSIDPRVTSIIEDEALIPQ